MVCEKARKILGLLYRRFYNASAGTLCQLYLSLVRPYASPVWSPHLAKDKELIEGVQKFALRIASKNWTMTYHDLLNDFNLPTLETRRCEARLIILFKITRNLCACRVEFPVEWLLVLTAAKCACQNQSIRTDAYVK